MQNVTDKKFLIALGENLRKLRLAKNLTQEDLGFLIGNSGKQIGRIERGENNVTSCMLYSISKALKLPLKDIFDFEIKKPSKKSYKNN